MFKEIEEQNKYYKAIRKNDLIKITIDVDKIALDDSYLHLDGILTALAIKKALGREALSLKEDSLEEVELPLISREIEGYDIYLCTHLKLDSTPKVEKVKKRFDELHLKYCKNKKINTQRGHFKALNQPFLYYLIEEPLVFYCAGDLKEVRELFKYLDGVGGKRRLGFGKVKSLEIKSVVSGSIKRKLPIKKALLKVPIGFGAVTPPYFKNKNETTWVYKEIE